MIAVQTTTETMQVHDELAALLARNLTLGSVPISMPVSQPPVPAQTPVAPTEQPKIVYSITQHYHHSAHAVKPAGNTAAATQGQQPQQPTPEQVLAQNGIDPSTLTAVQLALFKMSAPDRRDYLLQLWRICPPTRTAAEYNAVAAGAAWDTIEVEMEKEIASSQMRAQQSQHIQQEAGPQEAMSLDGTIVPTTVPAPAQSSDGRWLQSQAQGYMEPYMASGYEELAQREYAASNSRAGYMDGDASTPRSKAGVQLRYNQATDPVYSNRLAPLGWASWPQTHQDTTDMENQYGTLMAMRDGCEMEM